MADDSITAEKIQEYAIKEGHITPYTIQSKHLASRSIQAGHLDTSAITTETIANEAVTGEKIANQSIGLEKLNFNPFIFPMQQGVNGFQISENEQIITKEINLNQPFIDSSYIVVAMTDQANLTVSLAKREQTRFTLQITKINNQQEKTDGSIFWIAIGQNSINEQKAFPLTEEQTAKLQSYDPSLSELTSMSENSASSSSKFEA